MPPAVTISPMRMDGLYPPDVGDGPKRRTWATENGDGLEKVHLSTNRCQQSLGLMRYVPWLGYACVFTSLLGMDLQDL